MTEDLRTFVKQEQERVATFCHCFLSSEPEVDERVIQIFRRFGELFRRKSKDKTFQSTRQEMIVLLYRVAWEQLQSIALEEAVGWSVGRDVRKLKALDENVLYELRPLESPSENTLSEDISSELRTRLRRVDTENRGAVILKDILGFSDDDAIRILSTRWGVFRHRLHRGRLDLVALLKGNPLSIDGTSETTAPRVTW